MLCKKYSNILLMFLVVAECLLIPVRAVEGNSVFLSDNKWETFDSTKVVYQENHSGARTTGTVNFRVEANSTESASEKFYLEAGETVMINCSYTPTSASVDFGLRSSNGVFYSLNVVGGSINTGIRVNEYNIYTFVVRNNSANTIKVTGYITY